jgi:hypothetical protein
VYLSQFTAIFAEAQHPNSRLGHTLLKFLHHTHTLTPTHPCTPTHPHTHATHTHPHTHTRGRISLREWSACHRDRYLHNINIQKAMLSLGFVSVLVLTCFFVMIALDFPFFVFTEQHTQKTSMPPARFETAIPAIKRLKISRLRPHSHWHWVAAVSVLIYCLMS